MASFVSSQLHSKLPPKNNSAPLQILFHEYRQPLTTPADAKETAKKRIIELSLKHKILSPHTGFVGVEKRTNANNADIVLREVLIQISADDQHLETSNSISFSATSNLMDDMMSFGSMSMN